jgi:predicted DCC family thiol-disulfide oxidoreductase YuxK
METKPIILYDGTCNLCYRSINFIIHHDIDGLFHLVPLQSEEGNRLLAEHGIKIESLESVILVEDSRLLSKSEAIIRVSQYLPGWWPVLSIFSLFPKTLRDAVYDHIACNRYNWFGRHTSCPLPQDGEQDKFTS